MDVGSIVWFSIRESDRMENEHLLTFVKTAKHLDNVLVNADVGVTDHLVCA